jgi:hypothetical protein
VRPRRFAFVAGFSFPSQNEPIKLSLILLSASAVIKFTVPGPGAYYLFSCGTDKDHLAFVEVSNHVATSCHVSVKVHRTDPARLYWVQFIPRRHRKGVLCQKQNHSANSSRVRPFAC